MAASPEFSVGDIVYLTSSAAIGKLDSFKISGIKQIQDGRWLYRIDIHKKPPHQQLIGDSFDARVREPSIFYSIEELITLCEAMDLVVISLENRIRSMEARADECSDELMAPKPVTADSKFNISDEVYFDASARLGFIEKSTVKKIFVKPIQPGSKRFRYTYNLNLRTLSDDRIIFREDELLTYCEAIAKALNRLNGELATAIAQRDNSCGAAP